MASNQENGAVASEAVLRQAFRESEKGAPEAGHAVGDIFSTDEIFRRIIATADEEFSVSGRLLFLSGLAGGLAMSVSFLGVASVGGALGGKNLLVQALLYPLGFIFVALGRYQLFTENTITPVTLVLTRIASVPRLLRIWGLVLAANLLGTALAAFVFARTEILAPEAVPAAAALGEHLLEMSWAGLFWKGIVAGWLVAGMVWLNHAARNATARLLIVFFLMYTVGAAGLAHCIVGSAEVLFLVFRGEATVLAFLVDFLVPAVLGNTLGGVFLVATLNYAQTSQDHFPDCEKLPWKAWLFQNRGRDHYAAGLFAD